MIPEWYEFVLLSLIAWRVFQLIGHDDILDVPRRKLLRLGSDWEKEGDPVPENYRVKWGLFITCPYCAGFWIAGLIYIAWMGTIGTWPDSVSDVLVAIGVWFALSAGVIAASKVLSEEEE